MVYWFVFVVVCCRLFVGCGYGCLLFNVGGWMWLFDVVCWPCEWTLLFSLLLYFFVNMTGMLMTMMTRQQLTSQWPSQDGGSTIPHRLSYTGNGLIFGQQKLSTSSEAPGLQRLTGRTEAGNKTVKQWSTELLRVCIFKPFRLSKLLQQSILPFFESDGLGSGWGFEDGHQGGDTVRCEV